MAVQNRDERRRRLASARTIDDLQVLCRNFSKELGIQYFVYAL